MIGEGLKEIIKEGWFRSVHKEHKFKVKNWVTFGPWDDVIGHGIMVGNIAC
jgi:hypothetical protein